MNHSYAKNDLLACIARLQATPDSQTEEIRIELDDDTLNAARGQAERLGCTVEIYIAAIVTIEVQRLIEERNSGA